MPEVSAEGPGYQAVQDREAAPSPLYPTQEIQHDGREKWTACYALQEAEHEQSRQVRSFIKFPVILSD